MAFNIHAALVAIVLLRGSSTAHADKTNQYDYAYGINGVVDSVAGFQLARTIDGKAFPIPFESIHDVHCGGGKIYFVDTILSRIHIFDAADYSWRGIIDRIADGYGPYVTLENPEGIFFSAETGELYIADTGAERIVVLDAETSALKRIITRPENMAGVTNFKPSKIAVDSTGRIYCVVQGSFEGIIELHPTGSFSRFYGVNKPDINLLDYFWKSVASQDQKAKMAKTFAPSFSNLDIDREGFVYAVSADSASEKMIFRFNAKGENVIREEGYTKLRGDLTRFFINRTVSSAFTGIAVRDSGAYAVVDRSYGRVFVYDFDGYLLTVFSRLGDITGDLREPSAVEWNGYDILVSDKNLDRVYVYTPTAFGRAALLAAEFYSAGDWEQATQYFEEAVRLNANFFAGYSGLGLNYLMKQDYGTALCYFKMAGDTAMYSQAYKGYRGVWIQKHFALFIVLALLLAGGVIFSELRYARKNRL